MRSLHPERHLLARLAREPLGAWPGRAWNLATAALPARATAAGPTVPFEVPGPPAEPLPAHDPDWRSATDAERRGAPGPWRGSHEAAFRMVAAVRAGDGPGAHALAARILAAPSTGTSAANHRIGELGALALAARVAPRSPLAPRFREGASGLGDALRAQLRPDGLGAEGSVGYHLQNLEWADLARRCGVSGLDGPLARGVGALRQLLDADGSLPDLGDDDGGGLRGGLAWERLAALGSGVGEPLEDLTVLARGEHRLVLDHGPHGLAPLYAHAHADALAVWWAPRGRWALGGRGTGRYLGDAADRRFRRGTSAHATLVLDGADSSVAHDDPFLWRTTARSWREDRGADWVRAAHDGWLARRGVLHRRAAHLGGDGALHLVDWLEGSGPHHVALGFPLRPGAQVALTADARLAVREREELHSPAYGRFEAARTLVAEAVLQLPVALRTTLRPGP